MVQFSRRTALFTLIGGGLAAGAAFAQQHRMRYQTVTQGQPLSLVAANRSVSGNRVSITVRGGTRVIACNGIPDHKIGKFPNSGNPNRISAQSYRFKMPVSPRQNARSTESGPVRPGVGLNGVPFDPNAGEFWQGNPRSGWRYEALSGAVALGVDANHAHVQPTGAYHYHGLPIGLMQNLGWSGKRASPLIGYAADGFPIYALTAAVNGRVVEMTSSYRLRRGNRPGGNQPGGSYDGSFAQDYVYRKGAGTLDECNGALVRTAEYPQGTYAYFLTRAFPVVPRRFRGTPDASFRHQGGPGGPDGPGLAQGRPPRKP
ncbi:MAG: YHYH protein [Rhodobacteraceae bacterium]|nr:YHYH protein [Paracoccaceae bacterium]